jgi:hypothetical protein
MKVPFPTCLIAGLQQLYANTNNGNPPKEKLEEAKKEEE